MDRVLALALAHRPFLFIISYDAKKLIVHELDKLPSDIFFKVDTFQNYTPRTLNKAVTLRKFPISFDAYKRSFDAVIEEIQQGNTYLLNLTKPTPIQSNLTLLEMFHLAQARYKLYYKGEFICFSPESFIEIKNQQITTYPMKGTIDASLPNAKERLLDSAKELAEHTMVVDLLRNDLSMVAKEVRVERFRYIEKIQAGNKELLQTSSKIVGKLEANWQANLSTILTTLLPAGSISGTPKKSTCAIIDRVEEYERGFYSGVFGVFDGTSLKSAIMIRYIEQNEKGLMYKSGGGITLDSDAHQEYQEMVDKVYIPTPSLGAMGA